MGMSMPAWYDIVRPRDTVGLHISPPMFEPSSYSSRLTQESQTNFGDLQVGQDEPGILKSRDYFHGLIKAEVDGGIASDRVVLGGFSQGGAMSLFSGITAPYKLGGIFGLSCYLVLHNKIKDLIPANNPNQDTPILMGHGDADPLVKPQWGERTAHMLKELGFGVSLNFYQ